jgi:hypothetical protein
VNLAPPAPGDEDKNWKEIWKEKAPEFVLLGLGAIITSFLIPYFFDQWQANQEELEIKNSLV